MNPIEKYVRRIARVEAEKAILAERERSREDLQQQIRKAEDEFRDMLDKWVVEKETGYSSAF